jgi:hypothetical protein
MRCLFAGGSVKTRKFSPAIVRFATAVCESAVQVSLTPLAETKRRGAVDQNL